MTGHVDFAVLLAPLAIADFTRKVLGVRSFVATSGRNDGMQAGLVGWREFNDLLAMAVLAPDAGTGGRIEVRVAERRLGPEDLCRSAPMPGKQRPIDPARLTHAVRGGARLVIHEVEAIHRAVARLCEDVGRHLRASVTARLLAVWQSPWHARYETAGADLLLVQLAGSQRWETRPGPAMAVHAQEANTLEPGAVAYVPRGWLFKNRSIAYPTLQLFLEVSLPPTRELVAWVAARLLEEDSTLRESLPEDPVARANEQAEILKRLAAACEDSALIDRFRTEQNAAAVESRAWFGFPWTATRDVLPTEDVVLRLNGPRFPETCTKPDRVEFRMRGARFELDERIADVLAPIFAGQTRTVGQLLTGQLTNALREALVDLLLAGHIVPDENQH
jgi:hypothetical protein